MMPNQPFMGPRGYPGGPGGPRGPGGVRMPQGMGNDFNGPPGQPLMPNNMDPTRQGQSSDHNAPNFALTDNCRTLNIAIKSRLSAAKANNLNETETE